MYFILVKHQKLLKMKCQNMLVLKNIFQQSQVMLFENVTGMCLIEGSHLYRQKTFWKLSEGHLFYRINPNFSSIPLTTLCLDFPEEQIHHTSFPHPHQTRIDQLFRLYAARISQSSLCKSHVSAVLPIKPECVILQFTLYNVRMLRAILFITQHLFCLSCLLIIIDWPLTVSFCILVFFVLAFPPSWSLPLFSQWWKYQLNFSKQSFLPSACALTLTFSHLDCTIELLWVLFSFSFH